MLSALLVYIASGTASHRWRVATLAGYSVLAALLAYALIAGPGFGAFAGNRFWPLFGCAVLIEVTVVAVCCALFAVLPRVLAIILAMGLFIFIGLPVAGATGTAMMPPYCRPSAAGCRPAMASI